MNIRSGGKRSRREADTRDAAGGGGMDWSEEPVQKMEGRREGRKIPGSRWGSAGAPVSSAQTSSVENGGIVQISSFRVLRV